MTTQENVDQALECLKSTPSICFEIMAKSVLPALELIDIPAQDEDDRWRQAEQQTIQAMADATDWDSYAQQFQQTQPLVSAPEAKKFIHTTCDHLTSIAFSDAEQLANLALHAVGIAAASESSPELGNLLQASRSELLRVARLTDLDKWLFFNAVNRSAGHEVPIKAVATIFNNPKLDFLQNQPSALVIEGTDNVVRLKWIEEASAWLDQHDQLRRGQNNQEIYKPQLGCPAARETTEVDGHKTVLLSAFWGKLINKIYPTAEPLATNPVKR